MEIWINRVYLADGTVMRVPALLESIDASGAISARGEGFDIRGHKGAIYDEGGRELARGGVREAHWNERMQSLLNDLETSGQLNALRESIAAEIGPRIKAELQKENEEQIEYEIEERMTAFWDALEDIPLIGGAVEAARGRWEEDI